MSEFYKAFIKILFIAPLLFSAAAVDASQWQTIKYVIDGDTVVLSNGDKVRLLGIDTPEIARQGKPNQVGAVEAKKWLMNKVLRQRVRLEKSAEFYDQYGRTLAFLINQQGENINVLLLKRGLARLSIYPPNTRYLKELSVAQGYAEKRKLGLWADSKVLEASHIAISKPTDWGRYKGTVHHVELTKRGYKLWLTQEVYIWLSQQFVPWFDAPSSYQGKKIEVRGRAKKWGHKDWSIKVRHNSQLIIKH